MKLLYSNILPLGVEDGQTTILDEFNEQVKKADRIYIAVGYISRASLIELENMVEEYGIKKVVLTIGMYYIEGMPESSYHTAIDIDKRWREDGIGEIRMVTNFKYHGKLYCFYNQDKPFSAIIGSANLGVIKPEATNRRQYEMSALTVDEKECLEIAQFIQKLNEETISQNISVVTGMTMIREENRFLSNVELVNQIPEASVKLYERCLTYAKFVLPLKVPAKDERHMDDNKHYTKSNINVCYAAPRNKRKARDWFETQLTVSKAITRLEGYPEKNKTFFVITDDGYQFKAHTTSDGNKQFSAVGDELILGRWIKGRMAAAGLVNPVNNTQEDTDRTGMITKEMLEAYGCNQLVLQRTNQKLLDEDGNELDVWMLSFVSNSAE